MITPLQIHVGHDGIFTKLSVAMIPVVQSQFYKAILIYLFTELRVAKQPLFDNLIMQMG